MNNQSASEILRQYEQRTTDQRLALLELLMDKSKAFAFSEIERQLTISIDRATIYRTLQTFEAVGLVIRMVDHQGNSLFMFNHKDHSKLSPHPHLYCKNCREVVCLPSLPKEYVEGLKQYVIGEMYFLMEGICQECLAVSDESSVS